MARPPSGWPDGVPNTPSPPRGYAVPRKTQAQAIASTVVLPAAAAAPVALAVRADGEVLAAGTQLDHYVIERQIGAGGMGVVYQAHDALLDRFVALKVLPPRLYSQGEYLRRFAREAQIQAYIDSPHVVSVHALVEREVGLVLVMEHLEGETLEQRLQRGPLPVAEAIDIFEQACVGIEHVHRAGIIHRDIKPANIFITSRGRIKLMDFGVARRLDDDRLADCGSMMGTLLYMSPEQIKGHEIDTRCDIYALGITLFEALTGRLPFERKTQYALMHAHVQENPPLPSRYQREIPHGLEKVILKAIAKEPTRRFQSIVELRQVLARYRTRWRRARATDCPRPLDRLITRRLYPRYALPARGVRSVRQLLLGPPLVDAFLAAAALSTLLRLVLGH